jgi:hypothetical protein
VESQEKGVFVLLNNPSIINVESQEKGVYRTRNNSEDFSLDFSFFCRVLP